MQEEVLNAFVSIEIPVQWGNMDAAQHVNNTVYLRWIESARIEMIQRMSSETFTAASIFPILAWQDCKYIFPVTYPDQVIITYNVQELKEDRAICIGKIYSKRHNRLVAISNSTLMAYDTIKLKKLPFPDVWKKVLINFYGNAILT